MPNNNVAILSIMSKFDEKSAREAAKRADKVYEEALSDIGNVNFDKKLIENFDKAMNLLKNKFKKVNLSSYTNSLLDSIFSDKDIKEKSKDIELFISKIEMLKKASSGQDINAFNTFSAKQIDALISRTEKLAEKQEEINEKTREYNREATKIAKTNRSISTIDKNYGNQDYSKTLESLKKSLGTEKEFTAEQNQSIENLAKMVNLYQVMEKSEPQKGTAEAIRYSKDLLAVTQKIKEERDKIDAFSQKGASTYIANNELSSVDKVSDYTVNKSKEDFVKASLSNLKSQEVKLQSELTTYISDSVQKNLAKVSKEVDAVVDKAEKRVENLQNKIESLQTKSTKTGSDNSIIGGIVSETDIKSLEEIEDRLYAISDLDAEGEATKQQLKEYIQLYKQYEQLVSSDPTVKFDPGLKEEYDFILESDSKLKKYADTLDKTVSKQNELNDSISNADKSNIASTQTEQFVKQEELSNESINNLKNNLDIAKKDIEDLSLRIKNLEDNSSFSNISEQVFNLSNAIETLDQKLLSVYEKLDKINETNLDWGKIQYHQGNLENIKNTRSRDDFGDMISGLIHGGYLERGYGYGSGGTGLYTAMNTEDFSDFAPKKNGKQSVFGYAIDWSKYPDAFVAETEEVAKDLHVFLSNLEAFCIKLGSGFKGFDEQLGDIDEQKLYNQYQNIFHEVRMDFDEFQNFISEMSSLVKSAGDIKDVQFTSISNELSTSDNISTRFMRANGYSGINVSSVKNFDNADIGSVLYDIRDGAIIKRFETLYDLKEFADRQIQEINKVVTSNNVASIDVQKIINDISEIKNEILELNEAKQNIQDAISSLDQSVVNTTSTALPSNKSNISSENTIPQTINQQEQLKEAVLDTATAYEKMTEAEKEARKSAIQTAVNSIPQAENTARYVHWGNIDQSKSILSNPNGMSTGDYGLISSFADCLGEAETSMEAIYKYWESLHAEGFDKGSALVIDIPLDEVKEFERGLKDNIPQEYIKGFVDTESNAITLNTTLQNGLKETAEQAEKTAQSVQDISKSQIEDVFQGEAEKSGMDAIASATEEAVQSKKDFATANEGVQSSIDSSKSPLQLEAELMNQIAKSAREAADTKKEFVEANKQVKDSVVDTNEEKKIENTEENANAWKELTYSIQRYSEVSKRISSGKALEGDIEEASRLENKISQLQKLDILSPTQIEKSEQMLTKLYDTLDDIEKKSKEATLESLNSSIDKYRNDYNSRSSKPIIDNQSDEYKKLLANYETSIKELEDYRDKIRNNPLVSKEDLNQIDELTKKVKESATAFNGLTASQKGSTPLSRGKTIEWANDLLEQNSKWSKKAKIEVQGWINKLATADPSNVEEIRNRILEIVRAEREAGNAGKTWLDIFSTKKLHNFLGQAASMFSFYDLVNVGREIVTNIKEVDTALTELRKVSDATEQRLTANFKNSADTAKELGATVSDVISATADWSRMGYNIDQAEELARVSTLYKNVGDGIDIETANNSLISTLQGFQLDASEAESIIDKFNEVANNYAIDSAGIGEALQRSAASFNAANTDLSKSIALITATNEVVQDPDSVGTLWKTMSARIRGAETELEELGEETDEYTKTTSKLRDLVQSLTGFDIMIDEDTFKDVYEIILGIGKEWDNLTDVEQASLGEALAGKRNANALYAVLGNLDTLQAAYETAENSAGSAMREQENYEKSIQYSLDRLSASVQEWSNTLVSSDVIKWFVDLANAAVELSTALTPLGTLALGGGLFAGIKNIGRPKMFGLYKYADINMCSLGY